jgi:hypothetical protein
MKQDNVTPIFLPNFGYLMRDIPNELFEKLKKESFEAESIRKTDFLENEFVSGLSGSGVVKHFYVKDSLKELNEFVLETFLEYDKVFNYLQTIITLSNPVPLVAGTPWINVQKKHEFNPNHIHDGIASYTIWIKIPYDVDTEIQNGRHASTFEFSYNSITGSPLNQILKIDKSWEGKMIIFPSTLQHCVYPFYTSDEYRISIAGNILLDTSKSSNAG